jgi:N-acetylneuraminate synthase
MIKIGKIEIKKNQPPLIIPEMGINHNGNFEIAIKIIRSAKKAGAMIIKNQTHIPDDEYSEEAKKIIPDNSKRNIFDLIKKCSFSEEEEFKLKIFTEKLGLEYISTPFSKAAVDRLIKLKVKLIKIGSGECNNYPLIDYISKKGLPVILSTGMNDFKSVKIATNILKKNNTKFALNHCTNIYPSDFQEARLNCITKLIKQYPKNLIGLSDHSRNNLISLASIPLGISMIEKHFVDTKRRKGPDISSSMDERDLKDLIENSKNIFSSIDGEKKILKKEINVAKFAFASVVSIKNISRGQKLSADNIWVKRPGNGDFLAKDLKKLLGKRAKKNIKKNIQIKKTFI